MRACSTARVVLQRWPQIRRLGCLQGHRGARRIAILQAERREAAAQGGFGLAGIGRRHQPGQDRLGAARQVQRQQLVNEHGRQCGAGFLAGEQIGVFIDQRHKVQRRQTLRLTCPQQVRHHGHFRLPHLLVRGRKQRIGIVQQCQGAPPFTALRAQHGNPQPLRDFHRIRAPGVKAAVQRGCRLRWRYQVRRQAQFDCLPRGFGRAAAVARSRHLVQ